QEFERVGGTSTIRVDVRIIATTNRDLAAEAERGAFRQDLYYRLSTIPIAIPPLRDRKDDIPALAYRFAIRIGAEMGKEINSISPEGIAILQRYDWPGNVRELQHVVERAVILSSEPVVPAHAFEGLRFGLANSLGGPVSASQRALIAAGYEPPGTVREEDDGVLVRLRSLNVDEAEAHLIAKALETAGNNRTRAAELLGMSVRTLRNKLNAPTEGEATLAV
ncbi:MAG: sigma 54-interacting transcriptional regulator, partial [Gemmatimonadaceae bacterium]